MHDFRYAAPRSLEETAALMAEHGAGARLLAGGTDLIVKMRARRAQPALVIDTKHVPELSALALDDAGLTIGAAVSCRRICEDPAVASAYPALVDCGTLVGGTAIQGRASFGGNLCNAAPSADTIPALIVLGARARILGPAGTRELAVEDFCVAPGRNALAPEELLVSLWLPPPPVRAGAFFLRFIPRNEMDIAVVNAAAALTLDPAGTRIEAARIAIGAVAPTPLLVTAAGAALAGRTVTDETIEAAARAARDAARPIDDMRGGIEQRRHLAGILTARAIRGALARARETER
ncbi:MAG: xanthine dehydrogenase family protein subunit M [Gammaproteobacteria bacterium]|nr:xanthine dehydrogenase family protein subunit M [Gammaproteobacteria bacterium]